MAGFASTDEPRAGDLKSAEACGRLAGSAEKVGRCLELGADRAINYKTEDVGAAIRDFATEGLDVFWDTTREPDLERAVSLLGHHGRIILMAGLNAHPTFPVGAFYTKDCSMHGFAITNATSSEHAMPDWVRRTALADILGVDFEGLEERRVVGAKKLAVPFRSLDRGQPLARAQHALSHVAARSNELRDELQRVRSGVEDLWSRLQPRLEATESDFHDYGAGAIQVMSG